jgi:hypothetical protein
MSYDEILNHNELTRKINTDKKSSSNEEKSNDMKVREEEKLQKPKLEKPIIYTEPGNKENKHAVNEGNNSLKKDQPRIDLEAKEITNYYFELHKNMINTYNFVYSQLLQNHSNLSWSEFFNDLGRSSNYQFDNKNMYTRLMRNKDESLHLLDIIITENLDAFIKSIELTQRFYKDIIESYLNYIRVS